MPRITKPLTDKEIKSAKPREKPYKLNDGQGLYVLVEKDGTKFWRFNYTRPITKKSNTLSFGTYPELSLAEARLRKEDARKLVSIGIDPSDAKKTEARKVKMAAEHTFEAVALEWLSKQKYAPSTLDKAMYIFVLPFQKLGKRPINEILPIEVLDVCRIAEKEGHLEKAKKMRIKFSQVFRYGVATSRCAFDPTRDLKGALEAPDTKHRAALINPLEVGRLLNDIDNYVGRFTTVCALKLAVLLFVRPGELRAMTWDKLDLTTGEWQYTPPKTKKSTGIEMLVPLPRQAVDILRELHAVTSYSDFVIPAIHTKLQPMSENTVNQALRRMGWESDQVCGHGFRATARTILEEELEYPPELIEMQLGHQVRDPNGRAYNRTWKIKQRKVMMQSWADYLDVLRIAC